MIVLFNLNTYLGGGEVLLVRLALEFATINVEFCVVGSFGDGYINDEMTKLGLRLIRWPSPNDSVIYMNNNERRKTISYFHEKFSRIDDLQVFTFCFRDVYNATFVFSNLDSSSITYSTGVFHPYDTRYLSSYSISKRRIVKTNRALLQRYVKYDGVSFMNEGNLKSSLETSENDNFRIIPLPITGIVEAPKKPNSDRKRIVWIGRFVDFKISAIMGIIDYVRSNPEYNLTLIGYGNCERRIRDYLRRNRIRNVELIGRTLPEELDKLLLDKDIGYCMGTSVLETAKLGIPTIIAPMLPKMFYKQGKRVCLGIFGEDTEYNLGEVNSLEDSEFLSLDKSIEDISRNYSAYSELTLKHIEAFSMEKVALQYLNLIQNSKFCIKKGSVNLPKAPLIKYFGKRIIISATNCIRNFKGV